MKILLMSLFSYQYQIVSADEKKGTIRVEGTLEEDVNSYYLPKDGIFVISDNNDVCPSNQCKLIPKNLGCSSSPSGMFITFSEEGNSKSMAGCYRLQDDITNGHFTPKKQELVEGVHFYFRCSFDDIQEDLKNGTAKYICSDEYALSGASRTFNNTDYPYTFSASFELPSRHFVLNATELTGNPIEDAIRKGLGLNRTN